MSFKGTFTLDQSTDVSALFTRIEREIRSSNLPSDTIDSALRESKTILDTFEQQGMALLSAGSQMRADQLVSGPGYNIKIRALFGVQQSFWKRIFGS